MVTIRTLSLPLLAALFSTFAAPAEAQQSERDSVAYALTSPPSRFEWGCFGACACPVSSRSPLTGGFVLRFSHHDPLYTWYDVLDVRFRVPDSTQPVSITGSGTYRIGGEVALMEELTLDLSFNDGPIQTFTSGLRPPGATFPEIHTRVSLHGEVCFDSVLEVSAKSIGGVAGADGSKRSPVAAVPNPFRRTIEVAFVLPREGRVDLGVFDLAGRRFATLVRGEWLASGVHRRVWDGRREDGSEAPPGVYSVRMDSPVERWVRPVVKLR